MLDSHADHNIQNGDIRSALRTAIMKGSVDMVACLLQNGAVVYEQDIRDAMNSERKYSKDILKLVSKAASPELSTKYFT